MDHYKHESGVCQPAIAHLHLGPLEWLHVDDTVRSNALVKRRALVVVRNWEPFNPEQLHLDVAARCRRRTMRSIVVDDVAGGGGRRRNASLVRRHGRKCSC
jgi:hypothetical protein